MGSKKGGGARTPYEAPNTLNSAQNLRIIDAISEGEIAGFAHGNDAPFKSIYFDDTPVQNADGSFNFHGVTGYFQVGTPDQSYIPNFDVSERTVSVSASVKKNTPIIRAITDNTINRLRVTVGVERNAQVKDNGDTVPASTELVIELVNNSGVQASRPVLFSEKGSGAFYHDVMFDSLPAVPFNIRVRRITADSTSDKVANNTFFASYVEMIDAKLSYPHTALSALKIDSDQFGNSVPRRNYLLRGKLLQVPSNYDPETRQYSGGLWDGSFKTAWTNNPAWVFYDLLTNERYSTLAHRLTAGDIDKWALYQIAKYCDELVPDGFGGQEPRFVCNAYITDQRQAGELLNDLASVFCGLAVWNGNQICVMQDKHTDPVAVYSNANVVDGEFNYAGASLKSIHTAVHVRYADKHDGYRSKVEYIADDEAVARYGLNIKSVTAFGCDSRGQAVRFGTWILQTELRQQNTVSFSVGREGLKHLPYDVIRIADNDYAGAQLGGRVVAVSGDTITLDRDVSQAVGALLYYVDGKALKNIKIIAQPKNNQVRVETAISIKTGDTWGLTGKVKSRLYRAVSIKENTDDGTYTITALLHDPAKYGVVDESAIFDDAVNTLHSATPELNNATVSAKDGGVVLSWDNLTADGSVLDYDIKIYRNNQLYRHIPDAKTPEIALTNLPNGDFRAEIRGRNARGVYSAPLIKAWSINYTITALRATSKTLAIELNWVLPEVLAVPARTEIWYGTGNLIANAQKLVTLPTPQNSYTLTGVSVLDRYYFWARLIDENGNTGEFTASVLGQADQSPAPIVAQIQGAITKSALSQALITQLQADDIAAENRAKIAAATDAANKVATEAKARADADRAEATARANAITAEQTARANAIKASADAQATALRAESNKLTAQITSTTSAVQANLTARVAELTAVDNTLKTESARLNARADDLTTQATALGTRITNAEKVNTQQATAIQTLTASQASTAAALETEKAARIAGDRAEATARETLATKVNQNTAAIATERNARTSALQAEATAREQLSARVDNIAVGGRNLLTGTAEMALGNGVWHTRTFRKSGSGNIESVSVSDSPVVNVSKAIKIKGSTSESGFAQDYRPVQRGWFVLSAWVKGAAGLKVRLQPFWANNNQSVPSKTFTLNSSDWVKLEFGGENKVAGPMSVGYFYLVSSNASDELYVLAPKMETGTLATDWTPAPEDVDASIATVQADIIAERNARTTADTAEARAREQLAATVASNTAAIANEAKARADGDKAEANQRATLATKVAQNTSAIDAERTARIAGDQAEARERNALATRVGTAESNITAERTARTSADAALTQSINAVSARMGTAESNISALRRTTTDTNRALAETQNTLTAKIDNINVGGRNYFVRNRATAQFLIADGAVRNADAENLLSDFIDISNAKELIYQSWVKITNSSMPQSWSGWQFYDADRNVLGNRSAKFGQGGIVPFDYHDVIKLQVPENAKYIRIGSRYLQNGKAKLEIGNTPTDWTPAPEDVDASIATVQADLTTYKSTQATKDNAQTAEINSAKSQINNNKSAIDSMRSTKADKTEVASLARTTLQSDWQTAATNAANAAKSAAATDAQAKADTAKNAAITAAATAAQAKADAAKAQAIASASTDAQAKADAAKAQAIADAAAKDAVIKQQAATDAQAKADVAKNAAIAEAQRLNTATNAKISTLEQTVSNQNSATATQINDLSARVDNIAVGGRNLLTGTADMLLGNGVWHTRTFRKSGSGNIESVSVSDSPVVGVSKAIKITGSTLEGGFAQDVRPVQAGWFTASAWVKGSAGLKVRLQPFWSQNNQSVPSKTFTLNSSNWVKLT